MKRSIYILASVVLLFFLLAVALVGWLWLANRPINNRTFDELNAATKISIRFPNCSIVADTPADLEISDPEKVAYAGGFIKNYPDNWIVPFGTPPPGTSFYIEFISDEINLGGYGVGPATRCSTSEINDSFLVYEQTVKHIDPESRKRLVATLEIEE